MFPAVFVISKFLITVLIIKFFQLCNSLTRLFQQQSGHDVRAVIDDTYHSNVDGNDKTCNDGDIEKEHVEASNQLLLVIASLTVMVGEMAGDGDIVI